MILSDTSIEANCPVPVPGRTVTMTWRPGGPDDDDSWNTQSTPAPITTTTNPMIVTTAVRQRWAR